MTAYTACIASRGKNHHFYVLRPSLFVCPGDALVAITHNVASMKRQFSAYQTPRSYMYPSIFNSFTVIPTASATNRRFHVPQPTFLFPLETPLRLSRKMLHGWKDNSMLAKPLAAWTHLSSTVSQLFEPQVQKNRRFHVSQPTFLFPLETPLRLSRKMLHGWKENSMLAKPLAAWTHLYSTVSQLFEPQVQKIAVFTYRSPHFCFPWGCPWGNNAKCCMDEKRIRCLQIVSLNVPM